MCHLWRVRRENYFRQPVGVKSAWRTSDARPSSPSREGGGEGGRGDFLDDSSLSRAISTRTDKNGSSPRSRSRSQWIKLSSGLMRLTYVYVPARYYIGIRRSESVKGSYTGIQSGSNDSWSSSIRRDPRNREESTSCPRCKARLDIEKNYFPVTLPRARRREGN